MKGIISVLVLCCWWSTQATEVIEALSPQVLQTDTWSLELHNKIYGKIVWKESSDDRVSITVTTQSKDVRVNTSKKNSAITITVTSRFGNAAVRAGGNVWLLMLGALMATHSRMRWLMAFVLLVSCPSYLADAPLTAHIVISTPQDFQFRHVELSSDHDTIAVPPEVYKLHNDSMSCAANDTDCPSCCHGNGECTTDGCSCKPGFYATDNCRTDYGATLEFHVNPDDPVILSGTTTDGDKMTISGEKDEAGQPTSWDFIQYKDFFDTYNIDLNDDMLPQKVASQGIIMLYEWSSDGKSVRVKVQGNDGTVELIVNVDLTQDVENRKRRSIKRAKFLDNKKLSQPNNAGTSENKKHRRSAGFSSSRVKRSETAVEVYVEECGGPVSDVTVWGDAKLRFQSATEWDGTATYQAESIGNGLYRMMIPITFAKDAEEIVDFVCGKFKEYFEKSCDLVSKLKKTHRTVICGAISGAIDLLTAGPNGDSVIYYRVCKKGFDIIDKVCDTVTYKPFGFEPLPSNYDLACKIGESFVDIFDKQGSQIQLTALAQFSDGTILTSDPQLIKFNAATAYTMTIVNGGKFRLTYFVVQPEDPAPYQDYQVSVRYVCASQGTLTMHIIGTDDYTDTETYITSPGETPLRTLSVPGAEQNVVDRVTVTYRDLDSNTFERQVIIVF